MVNKTIEPNELYRRIENEDDLFLFDIRAESEYNEWNISSNNTESFNYPYYNMLDDIPDEVVSKLPTNKDIIVICAKGKSSEMIADKLVTNGYSAVNLKNGMNGWADIYNRREIPINNTGLSVYQYSRPSSGCLSYMVVSNNEGILIDPLDRFTHKYVKDIKRENINIKYVVDTHIHADHISGLRKLSKEINAKRILSKNAFKRGVNYDVHVVNNNEKLEFGNTEITIVKTPGHTSGQSSYYIDGILFTGDSLFADSIARPDLEDIEKSKEMAAVLYDTLINKILTYPEDTIIAPAHASEDTPKNNTLNNTYTNTIGSILSEIPALSYDKDEFIEYVVTDMPPRPSNFEEIIAINKGNKNETDDKLFELELGPNNCATSQ